ncbi:NAD-dependent epimerase/dehydratase family protein [Nonlabens ulvanivorans]|uniref:Epimerase n=1 Tax=Nonlabens ulvanivorans TaxID=906888 RepID=A0A084JXS8_NONUL|nr:NAD-dependent epimerase/dehydratase family protein [Nonlabens ulvanivorans]KEZ93762.1 epimerase [Nonlabens ulvanivorans]PRX14359.1 UDP-glucose 4-epimerase [Nonlabens ulvanivorans]
MNKTLITGVAGNVGSALAHYLLKKGHQVVGVDNLSTGSISKLPEDNNFTFIKLDVNIYEELAEVMLSHKFDYVFHYAAMVGVQRTLDNPIKVLEDIDGIKNILRLSKNTGVQKVAYSSSSEVYGEPVSLPQIEDETPLNSKLPYAVVKNLGEAYFRSYHQEYGLDYTIFRFFNTYGPQQSKDFVIPKLLHQALHNEDITIYGDGLQSRTFCYIDDNIEASYRIFSDDSLKNEVFNIGSDLVYNIKELVDVILKVTGSNSQIIHLPALEEGDMTRRQPDNSKMKAILNRKLITLENGIVKLMEHLKK